MSRDQSLRMVPFCTTRIAPVDQYSFPEVDTTERTCNNGVSHPIYACNGEISRFLPLHEWPEVNKIHPQIRMGSQPHFMARDPYVANIIENEQLAIARRDIEQKRLEGFYIEGGGYDPYRIREQQIQKIVDVKKARALNR